MQAVDANMAAGKCVHAIVNDYAHEHAKVREWLGKVRCSLRSKKAPV